MAFTGRVHTYAKRCAESDISFKIPSCTTRQERGQRTVGMRNAARHAVSDIQASTKHSITLNRCKKLIATKICRVVRHGNAKRAALWRAGPRRAADGPNEEYIRADVGIAACFDPAIDPIVV